MSLEGFRAGLQQLGRRVRGRPGAAGRRHDQPGREDRPAGPDPHGGSCRDWRRASATSIRLKAARQLAMPALAAGSAAEQRMSPTSRAKEIIKEGLSEYFIYTIEGTETIPNGWSKRMRSFDRPACP